MVCWGYSLVRDLGVEGRGAVGVGDWILAGVDGDCGDLGLESGVGMNRFAGAMVGMAIATYLGFMIWTAALILQGGVRELPAAELTDLMMGIWLGSAVVAGLWGWVERGR